MRRTPRRLRPPGPSRTADQVLAEIEALARQPRVVAVGETGLDYYRDHAAPDVQRWWFREHIKIAKRTGKALMIHDREAHADVLRLLAEEGPPPRVVFHCFSGDVAMVKQCAEAGYVMSFAGNVTFTNAQPLRDAAAAAPPHLLLAETDAPFLTPVPNRGRPNEPAQVGQHPALPGPGAGPGPGRAVRHGDRNRAAHLRSLVAHARHAVPGPAALTPPALLGPADVRELAARMGVRPSKRLGPELRHRARERAADRRAGPALRPDDVVLEVGPGLGSLTLALLAAGPALVVAVEVDRVLAAELPRTIAARAPGLATGWSWWPPTR